ncbi:MAG: SigE family RNA polymerase sigma factor [Propionibacteriaceae bacterium]|nr:SigE family RNA polymerase sigma factor [Propionibacteriaceae bacterium]
MSHNDDEFIRFVTASGPGLIRLAWFLTGDADVAADVVQDAYTKTYVAWDRVRTQDAMAYARTVVAHANIDRIRRRHGETHLPMGFDRADGADIAEAVAQRDRITRMLAPLSRRQREVVALRYVLDLSEQTTAQTLGISVGAVKQAAQRALAALRAQAIQAADKECVR